VAGVVVGERFIRSRRAPGQAPERGREGTRPSPTERGNGLRRGGLVAAIAVCRGAVHPLPPGWWPGLPYGTGAGPATRRVAEAIAICRGAVHPLPPGWWPGRGREGTRPSPTERGGACDAGAWRRRSRFVGERFIRSRPVGGRDEGGRAEDPPLRNGGGACDAGAWRRRSRSVGERFIRSRPVGGRNAGGRTGPYGMAEWRNGGQAAGTRAGRYRALPYGTAQTAAAARARPGAGAAWSRKPMPGIVISSGPAGSPVRAWQSLRRSL